jgi:hypothetical protein
MIGVRIVDFRSVRRNSLLGFARVELPSGMVIADVTVMLAGTTGRPWASPPSKPMVDREGVVLKDPNGKIRYTPIIEFTSRENPHPLVRCGNRSDAGRASRGVRTTSGRLRGNSTVRHVRRARPTGGRSTTPSRRRSGPYSRKARTRSARSGRAPGYALKKSVWATPKPTPSSV